MAFKPRPPRPEEAEAPAKAPKPYRVKKAADPDIPPPKDFEEMGNRLVALEKLQMRWVGRRSELGRQIDYLHAVLKREGIDLDDSPKGIHEEQASPGEGD